MGKWRDNIVHRSLDGLGPHTNDIQDSQCFLSSLFIQRNDLSFQTLYFLPTTIISECLLPRYSCACKRGIFISKTKVDQEDDADAEDEDPGGDAIVCQAKAANGEEEHASDKVDEELKLRDAAANDVVEEDAGDNDGIANNKSLPKNASRCTFKVKAIVFKRR